VKNVDYEARHHTIFLHQPVAASLLGPNTLLSTQYFSPQGVSLIWYCRCQVLKH